MTDVFRPMHSPSIPPTIRRSRGFTLLELVIVILILGIITAVASSRVTVVSTDSREAATRQSLDRIRQAIELYKGYHGNYPGPDEASVKAALAAHLRGTFPHCQVGDGIEDGVEVVSAGTPLAGTGAAVNGATKMWKYDTVTGEFIVNSNGVSIHGTPYDEW